MLKSKTLWASVTAIVGALGAWFTGDIELGEMLQLVVTAGLAVFLRHGIKKSEDAADAAAEAASTVLPVKKAKKKTTG
jgi:hypothetical protein|tara:strand:- start:329 stop:562 length:234 start_codon:yes stop_codon:yes gene_type:complete